MSLAGRTFGRWLVKELGEPYVFPNSGYTAIRYICECKCGKIKNVREDSLLNGDSSSCGCLAKELISARTKTHGLSTTPLYSVWRGMMNRCHDSRRKDYKHYGGRGIKICDEWIGVPEGVSRFISDMQDSYKHGLEIDRIDVNGDYTKENCRWATRREQIINRRPFGSCFDTNFITYKGKTQCISQWAEEYCIGYRILAERLGKLKWEIEKALTYPVKAREIRVLFRDVEYKLKDVFLNTPNLTSAAKNRNKTTYQYCADLFNGIGIVDAIIDKQVVRIKPVEDLSWKLKSLVLTTEFRALLSTELHVNSDA